MKKKLSSDLTPLYKSLWIFFVIGLGIILFTTDMPLSGKATYCFFWVVGSFLLWGLYRDLRTVVVDAQFIYVTHNNAMAIIPISEVKGVYQITLFRHPVIIVELKNKARFGSEIRFIPYYVFRLPFTHHPVVDELKRLTNLETK
jgi:hypothetical protein